MLIPIILSAVCVLALCAGMPHGSPLRMAMLHNGAWAVALAIFATGLMRYTPLPEQAWLLISLSILIFNGGVILSARGNTPPRDGAGDAVVERSVLVTVPGYLLICLLFFIGFALYIQMIIENFGLATLLRDPRSIRASDTIAYMEEFPLLGKLLFYLGPICMVLGIFPKFVRGLERRLWRLPLVAVIAFAQLATLQRTNIFVALMWVLGLMVLNLDGPGKRRRGRQIMAMATAGAVAVIAFQGLASVLGKTAAADARISMAVDPAIRDSPWLSLMMYASSGIPAFGQLVQSDNEDWPPPAAGTYGNYNPQTYGAATLSGPLRVLPVLPQWNEVAPFTRVPYPTNVYTWLEPWYRDFREAGVLMASAVVGVIFGSLGRLRRRGPEYLLLAGLLMGLSGLATFVNRYGMVMTCVLYVSIWALGWSSRIRWTREQPDPGSRRDSRHLALTDLTAPNS